MFKIYIIILISIFSNYSLAASFDCSKAKTKIEKIICLSPEISKKDEELAKIYYAVNNASANNQFLIEKQKKWLKERNKCDSDKCLLEKYSERIGVIENWLDNEKKIDDFFLYRTYVGGDRYSMSVYGEMTIDKEYLSWTNSGSCKTKYTILSKEVGSTFSDIDPNVLGRHEKFTFKSFKLKLHVNNCKTNVAYLRVTLISEINGYLDVIEYDKNDAINARTHFN
ncbi:MAG: lysozyme inhibitor LprI family protein [Cellvibrio sp.]|uniref:lysozyme inhibitor LprI family protein n=1 Tax=Cellvibrio sp. TaxID=1965322 RepID=UPI00272532D7|nr:lysozyme inhibitor LprI family protein [Cellvibrio sp.]